VHEVAEVVIISIIYRASVMVENVFVLYILFEFLINTICLSIDMLVEHHILNIATSDCQCLALHGSTSNSLRVL